MWLREDIEKQADENINYTVNARSTDILGIEEAGIEIEALRGAARRLQMIQDFSNTLVSEFDIKKLMQLLLDKIFEVIPGDRGYIFSIDQEKDMLVLQAAAEKGAAEPPTDIQISHSLVRRALDEKIGILSADTLSDERFKDQGSIILSGMRSAMCVPLIFADEALGIIHLDSKSMANQFSQDDLKMLTLIANQAAISIRNNSLREQAVKDRTVRASLSSYVSPHLLDRILSNEINIDSAAQQVEVSLLFADIRGFTALSEELEPADVMELLNQYCGKMANIVFEHNGSIDKYIGDAIMAVFGSPQPEPDHARRAIECGIAMQQAAKDLSVGARPVYIGVGVHTGACVQGNLGGSGMIQFTAVGDAVNTASRLCSAAKPGQVIISADTLAEANAVDFQIDPMPPIELKGKSQPMEVYQVRVPGHSSVPIVQQQG
jgi:adenylate cyclase